MKTNTTGKPLRMRWFNFLRIFLLPLNFLIQMFQLLELRLLHYKTPEAWTMYNTIDLVYTLVSIVATVLAFLWMRKHKWKGVQCYFAALCLTLVYSLLTMVLYMIALNENWFYSAIQLGGAIVMLALNFIYFKKRKDQFDPFKVFEPLPVREEALSSAEDEDVIKEEDMYIEDYDEEYFKELMEKQSADQQNSDSTDL